MPHLFVYGTLRRGARNHRLLTGQRYIGCAHTTAGWTLHDLGGYPAMSQDTGDPTGVAGELWLVDDDALAEIDHFEGVPHSGYIRRMVPLREPAETAAFAYVYAYPVSGCPVLGESWPG